MAAEGDHIIRRYNYTGADGQVIPRDATHIIVAKFVSVILPDAFSDNDNIEEVIFDENVEKVRRLAFAFCPSLRRVIMPGVEVVERCAFIECRALTDVECGKLEIIKFHAFNGCKSLRSIDLPSARIVEEKAFLFCRALTEAKFSSELERIEMGAFVNCYALERITIPLKDGIITRDDTFRGCENLRQVDLVEGPIHETIAALQLEEWRNDMYEEIDSINQILPNTPAGGRWDEDVGEFNHGGNAQAIRTWIRSVIRKIIHYKVEHQRLLDEEIATTLQLVLPQDIVMNNVLPFVELPSYTFEVEDHEEVEDDSGDEE
eukprot:scaffold7522_cov202-Skeletonema_marinoi.AAC.13